MIVLLLALRLWFHVFGMVKLGCRDRHRRKQQHAPRRENPLMSRCFYGQPPVVLI